MTSERNNVRPFFVYRPWSGMSLDTWQGVVLIGILSIAPLLMVNLPPLVDLYGHLGRFAIQTELANRPELQPYFSYQWKLIGNLGTDLLVQALYPVLGLEESLRVIVIATQLLATAGILALSRTTHGSITPFALVALPLIYGLPFNFGFLNYSLSMALALLVCALWSHLRRAGKPVSARISLTVAGGVIWLCHTYGWGFLGLLCGSATLAEVIEGRERPISAVRRILGACWPLLLPLVPMILWRAEAGGAYTGDWSIFFKINWLISTLRTKWMALDLASFCFLICLLYWAIRERSMVLDKRMGIAALLSALGFLALPMYVMGSAMADMRLAPYGLAMALLAISPRTLTAKTLKIFSVVAFVFFAGRTITTGLAYIQQDRLVAEHLSLLDAMPEGSRVAFLVVTPCEADWPLPVLSHIGSMALVRGHGFVNDQWQGPGLNPLKVHYKAAEPFTEDPSQFVQSDDCSGNLYPPLSKALATLPRQAFSHVWIVGALPDNPSVPADLQPLPHGAKGKLYAVKGH